MKGFWKTKPTPAGAIPAPQQAQAHQERVLQALWPESSTRRRFLIGVGGSLPLVGGLARAATEFSPLRETHGMSVAVSGLPVWRIDTRWFAGTPRLNMRKSADAFQLEMRGARFPGTDIKADFALQARRQGAQWNGRFVFDAFGFTSEVDFGRWLLGAEPAGGSVRLARASLSATSHMSLTGISGAAEFRPDWSFLFEPLRSGMLGLDGKEIGLGTLRLELDAPAEYDAAHAPATRAWATLASGAQLAFPLKSGTLELGAGPVLAFFQAQHDTATMLVQPARTGDSATAAHMCWSGDAPVRLPVDEACGRFFFAGNRTTASASARWKDSYWHVDRELAVRYSTAMLGPAIPAPAAAPGAPAANASAPVADNFVLDIPGFDGVIFQLRGTGGNSDDDLMPNARDFARNDIPLEYYDLKLRRASDALFCTVRFRGLRLQRRDSGWRIVQIAQGSEALLEFDLGSQHLMEEAFLLEEWPCTDPRAYKFPIPPDATPPKPGATVVNKLFGATPTRFEAARPSHLTFQLKRRPGKLSRLPLTMEALFSWTDDGARQKAFDGGSWLEPRLDRRALPAGTPALRDGATSKDMVDDLVITRPSSLADQLGGTARFATAIEAPARLVVSPIPPNDAATGHAVAPWRSPPAGPVAGSAPGELRAELWHVRLMDVKIRAIYSADANGTATADPGSIQVNVFSPPDPFPDNKRDPFRASLDGRDRHELVALTSLYGFETLCNENKQVCAPATLPNGGTTLKGKYLPVPINAELLLLSSQGASFRYRGRWAPPASHNSTGALSVQRYIHWSQIGRDIFVKVEYKGFLFPIGHPAVLIKQTERQFCLRNGKQFVAGLLQRFFIHVPAFTRQFPSVDQGMDGRLWGHATTTMDEVMTPSLANPADSAFAKLPGLKAFWPRLPQGKNPNDNVLFEFYEQQSEARYIAPLVWIDNDVTHHSVMLKQVVDAWRIEVGNRLASKVTEWPASTAEYFAKVRSARLPYIPGVRGENTDIETTDILLGVQLPGEASGYVDAPMTCYGDLLTTPRMEAQNQPPFYPSRRRARIMSSQLATLTGKRSEAHLLQFDSVYARIGMAPGNASTVFAVFAEKGALLKFGDDTSKSGGFADPSTLMVEVTAKRGPVGGSETAVVQLAVPSKDCPAKLVRLASEAPAPSTSDDFNPREYFAAVLGDAKLLGVVRFVDILETLMAASGTSFPTIRRESLFELPLQALRDMMPAIENKLSDFDKWFSEPEKQQPAIPVAVAARLQPSWNRLRASVSAGTKVINQGSPSELAIIAAASDISGAAQALVSETRALAADPVLLLPEAAQELYKQAKELIDLVRQLLPPKMLIEALKPLLDAFINQRVIQLIDELSALIVNSPAYGAARLAVDQLKQLIIELRSSAADAMVLMESLKRGILQRLQAAAIEAALQLAMAGQNLLIGPTTLLGRLAPLIADQVVTQLDRYTILVINAKMPLTQPLLDLHKALDDGAKKLGEPKDGAELAEAHEIFSRLRQSVSAISDALNAHIDRMQRIAEGARALQKAFPPVRSLTAPSTALAGDLVPLLADVFEQLFDVAKLGMLSVTRLADMARELVRLKGKISESDLEPLRKAIAQTAASIGAMIPSDQWTKIATRLSELSKQDPIEVLKELWPIIGTAADAVPKLRAMLVDKGGWLSAEAEAAWTKAEGRIHLELQRKYKEELALLDSLDRLRGTLVKAVRALSPGELDARIRAEVQRRIEKLREVLTRIAGETIAQVTAKAGQIFCTGVGQDLHKLLTALHGSTSAYLSIQAKDALARCVGALGKCAPGATPALGEIFDSLSALMALLGRSLDSGDVSQLVSVEKVLDEIIAEFGIPTRLRLNYDWNTKVEAYPKGDDAIFEPLDERKLVIGAVIDTNVREGTASASVTATLSPYAVHLFGKVGTANFLSIYFDGLVLTAQAGKPIDCKTNVTQVQPGEALGFVAKLSELFGADSGFYLLPSFNGIEVGYRFASAYEVLGGLVLQNIAFSIAAILPFDNSPLRVKMQLADKEKPFLCSAGIYGGGGFLSICTRADTLELLEASFEYGAVVAFEYGPAKGSGRITAGIYIRMGGRDPVIEGFFCAQGEVNIAKLITMGASLRVTLTYRMKTGQTAGAAVYTFKFSIGFFDFKYSARVDYARDGDQGPERKSNTQALAGRMAMSSRARALPSRNKKTYEPGVTVDTTVHAGLLAPSMWRRYWRAFRPVNPDRPARIESVSRPALKGYLRNTDQGVDAAVAAMRAAVAAATASADALKMIEWYCVPWGVSTDKPLELRLSIRVMPKFCGDLCAGVKAAQRNWPAFMASVGKVIIKVNNRPVELDLGSLYVGRLKELGLTLGGVSRLWKEVFPATLPIPSMARAMKQVDPRQLRFKLHDTAELAEITAQRAGRLFADALRNFKPGTLGSFAMPGIVAQVPVSDKTGTLLDSMAAMYAPITSRSRIPLSGLAMKAAGVGKEAVISRWIQKAIQKEPENFGVSTDEGSVGTFATPYSEAALRYLDELLAPSVPIRINGTEVPESSISALPDPFARRLFAFQVAHTSDVPGQTYLEEENFHDRLAGLTTHPWLLKVLGLVVDITVPLASKAELASMKIMVDEWAIGAPPIAPKIRMLTHAVNGYPVKEQDYVKYSNCEGGCMDISMGATGAYLLSQIDVDRTPQRLLQLALAYRAEIMSGRRANEASSGMQAQETVGLSLLSKEPQLVPPPVRPPVPGIEDIYLHNLIIGYRPDVQRLVAQEDPAGARIGPWTSLMARKLRRVKVRGRDVTDLLAGIEVDEGILMERTRLLSDDPANEASGQVELVDGELFRWGNWVLGAPHPDTEGAKVEQAPKEDRPDEGNFHISSVDIEYDAAAGATPQRFGSGYRVGMRLVMIDGNSAPLDEVARDRYRDGVKRFSLGDETGPDDYGYAPFLRYEPILPPTPLLVNKPQRDRFPTESARKLVVASGAADKNRALTQRVLVAPRCASIDLAIRHGMFDAPGLHQAPPASAFKGVSLTPRGDFPSYNDGTGDKRTRDLYFRPQAGASAPQIPYYPDPWAQRMIIGFYRAADDCLLAFDFFDYYDGANRWPNCRALHLDLVAVDKVDNTALGFDWTLNGARLTVRIAPGVRLTLRTWHEMDVDKLNQSAVVDQLAIACKDPACSTELLANLKLKADACSADIRECVVEALSQWDTRRGFEKQTARPSGRASVIANLTSFWMLNPHVQLELLHAVAKPLRPAVLSDVLIDAGQMPRVMQVPAHVSAIEEPFRIVRKEAETSATFAGHVRLHRPSTRSLEAHAEWRDNARQAVRHPKTGHYAIGSEQRRGLLFNIAELAEVAADGSGKPAPAPMPVELTAMQNLQLLQTAVPVHPARPLEQKPVSGTYDFGDTRARVLEVQMHAYGRHGPDFTPGSTDPHLLKSPLQRVIAQGTERPAPPKIEYVIPLYNWSNGEELFGRIRRTRQAGWFRVWLDKDWYSVGNGELLAIVCWPDDLLAPAARRLLLSRTRLTPSHFATPPADIEPLVTRWGMDPLADQKASMGNMPASALKNRLRNLGQMVASAARDDATITADAYHLQDMPSFEPMMNLDPSIANAQVALALYRPVCDKVTGRWYADIQIDPQYAYCPLVRLGLARYQPHALAHLRMSHIVATEFIQLLPERTTTIIPKTADKTRRRAFDVVLAGATLSNATSAGASRTELSVRIENRRGGRGGWFELPLPAANPARDPWEGTPMVYSDKENVWRATVAMDQMAGRAYSLVIEEYEHLRDGAKGEARKLVFFDRIVLPSKT
jgi:hypothetical protein